MSDVPKWRQAYGSILQDRIPSDIKLRDLANQAQFAINQMTERRSVASQAAGGVGAPADTDSTDMFWRPFDNVVVRIPEADWPSLVQAAAIPRAHPTVQPSPLIDLPNVYATYHDPHLPRYVPSSSETILKSVSSFMPHSTGAALDLPPVFQQSSYLLQSAPQASYGTRWSPRPTTKRVAEVAVSSAAAVPASKKSKPNKSSSPPPPAAKASLSKSARGAKDKPSECQYDESVPHI